MSAQPTTATTAPPSGPSPSEPSSLRVLSLLPSATDTVVALKLQHMLVGRSHECDWKELSHLPVCTSSRVGNIPVEEIDAVMTSCIAAVREMEHLGLSLAIPLLEYGLSVYHLDTQKLIELRPDVILTCLQTAHSGITDVALLNAALVSVLGYTPKFVHCEAETLEAVWQDMKGIATALGAQQQGEELVLLQKRQMSGAAASSLGRSKPRTACIQWSSPLMAAGSWVPQLVTMAGGIDVCGKVEEAVVLELDDLVAAQPDVIIFALCGLPLRTALKAAQSAVKRLGAAWQDLPAVKAGKVAVVDGEHVFSRPGPLLGPSLEVLCEVFHPEAQRFGHEGRLWQWAGAGAC